MVPMKTREHARRQASIRGVDIAEVESIVLERVGAGVTQGSWAVLVGYMPEGGYAGFSNGDVVWAIVRGGELVTVMFRRRTQPATAAALEVERVVA